MSVAPDLVDILRQESTSRLNLVAQRVTDWIVGAVAVDDWRVDQAAQALRDGRVGDTQEAAQLGELVTKLDEAAWEFQESGSDHEYRRVFAQARAASSLRFALGKGRYASVLESLYEAQAARGDLAGVRAVVREALH